MAKEITERLASAKRATARQISTLDREERTIRRGWLPRLDGLDVLPTDHPDPPFYSDRSEAVEVAREARKDARERLSIES